MNEKSLNIKLNRVDETISIMKSNLGLPENELIENLATATNLHSLANIYIQESEPAKKDGIWIQANEQNFPYDTIKVDQNIILSGQWRFDNTTDLQISYGGDSDGTGSCTCFINDKLYYTNNSRLYEYDWNTKTTTLVCSLTGGYICTDGTYIYSCDRNTIYTVNPATKSVTSKGVSPSGMSVINYARIWYSPFDNALYMWSTNGYEVVKYDLATQTGTKVTSFYNQVVARLIPYKENELIMLNGNASSVPRILTVSPYKTTNISTNLKNYVFNYNDTLIDMGSFWYIISTKCARVLKLDKTTLEVEECDNILPAHENSRMPLFIHNKFYSITNKTPDSSNMGLMPMDMEEAVGLYDHNFIAIMQTPINNTIQKTAIWTYPCLEGRLCQSFWDVYYYNKNTGYHFDLPTYYGNGTEWIKFKN